MALIVPGLLGAAAFVLLRSESGTGGGLSGFVLAVMAAPLLPAWGVPLRSGAGRYLMAGLASAALWMVLGLVAAVRSTRDSGNGWRHYWGEYMVLMLCVWVGLALSLVMANLVLGRILV